MGKGRAVSHSVHLKEGDGEGDPQAPGAKYYDEAEQYAGKDIILPPKHNDLSSRWVALVIESPLTAEERKKFYGATFTTKGLVANWQNKSRSSLSKIASTFHYRVAFDKYILCGIEHNLVSNFDLLYRQRTMLIR